MYGVLCHKNAEGFFYIDNNLEYAVDRIDYDRIKSDYKQRSIERAYKYMLRQLDKKFHNVNEKESLNLSVEGLFYRKGDLTLKAEQLCSVLPVKYIINEEHQAFLEEKGLTYTAEDITDIEKKANVFFEYVFDKAGTKPICFKFRV